MIFSTSESHFHVLCWKVAFKQLQDAGIIVVTSMSINLPHALEVSSKTLWMLRCNIHFNTTSRVPRSVPKSPLNVPQSPQKSLVPRSYPKRLNDTVNGKDSGVGANVTRFGVGANVTPVVGANVTPVPSSIIYIL